MTKEKLSPGMQQYLDIKKDYPDAFLLFRMGDFYELFYDDAIKAAQILEISLTSRNKNADNPIPMAGVPYHSAQQYIDVLIDLGYKVAIAEQMEDPKKAVGVVKREVVQVRQVAMYLAKKHTDTSSSKIGQLIGNKDHATVLHACKIVKDQVEVDKAFKAEIEEIEASLHQK